MVKLKKVIQFAAILLAAKAALCPTSAYAYAPEIDGGSYRWNAVDLVGVAREDAQVLVDGKAVLRDGRRFVFSLPLTEGSSAHVTNLTLLARVSDDDEEWVAQQRVALRIPACPEAIDVALAGATVGDSLAEYLFDARNRLRRVTDKVGEPRLRAVYDYYPDGRRARKIVSVWNNDQWEVACTNQFLYDRWNLVREVVTDDGTVTTRDYTWGLDLAGLQSGTWDQESGVPRQSASGATAGGIGGLLAITEVSGTSTNILLPISDHVGTIHSLVAVVTGSVTLETPVVVAEYDYAPYGELISADGPFAAACPFGFQSKYYDPETGFWYYGYRYYDAKACKWLTADPLGEAGGLNLTAFCGSDPVNQVDALGLEFGVVPPGQAWQTVLMAYENAGPYYYGTEIWEVPIAEFANFTTFTANTMAGTVAALFDLLEVSINDPGAEWSAVFPAAPIASVAMAEQGGGMLAAKAWGAFAATRAGAKVTSLAASTKEWSARAMGKVLGKNAPMTGSPVPNRLKMVPSGAPKSTPTYTQMEFPFARGASVQTPGVTTAGERFVRVAAQPRNLKFTFDTPGGVQPGTYAFPESTFNAIGRNPSALKILGDLPGASPQYFRIVEPPAGTVIQRGIVPGGEFGGIGGVEEVIFLGGF